MTGEAPSAMDQPDPARSPAAGAHASRQHRRDGNTRRGTRAPTRAGTDPVRDDSMVIDLVNRARDGNKQAWDALVERYASLIVATG
jgi:hypothetical protein